MTVSDEPEQFSTANEFRSDTFTVPTRSMVEASFSATYGDSVYKEDATTLQLEEMVCEITGKEASLFCVSGTMSNQIGLRTHLLQPPHSVLCDYRSHVYLHEAGGLATLSQAMVHPVIPRNGDYLTLEDVLENFTPDNGDIHAAPTKVISLENTLHGMIMPIEEIQRISEFAASNGIKLHLDGARLWNAAAATGVDIKQYCSHFDSVSLCLSKSLGAPMGSMLVGTQPFINKANHFKKQSGGGIRQSGVVTAMAINAIQTNVSKLAQSHQYAQQVAAHCQQLGIKLKHPVHTNFVFIDFVQSRMDEDLFISLSSEYNVRVMGSRLAFHFQNCPATVDCLKKLISRVHRHSVEHPYKAGIESNKKLYNYQAVLSK